MSALVLVADADPFNLRLLSELCGTLGYTVATAADGGAVLDTVARERPSLVLMDVALPVMDGLAVLQILKSDQDLAHVPVVLVTAEGDNELRERGLALGAEDYVTKPYRTFELQQRLRNVLRLQAARGVIGEPLDRLEIVDPVTGAGTARQLHISLDYEFTRAVRYEHPLSCVVVRCENYEAILGARGAAMCQELASALASSLRRCIRGTDHLFRSRPEEFTLLLPETDVRGCGIVVERLRAATAEGAKAVCDDPEPTVVVGSASYPSVDVPDGESLRRHAAGAS